VIIMVVVCFLISYYHTNSNLGYGDNSTNNPVNVSQTLP
jgi:hypothetical protein